jgi:hypothetical protein
MQSLNKLIAERKSGNACSLSVQNLLSFYLLHKTMQIKVITTILYVLHRCKTWSFTLRQTKSIHEQGVEETATSAVL